MSALCALLGNVNLATADAAPYGWSIDSGPIDPAQYAGITVANGMIGIVSVAQPFGIQPALIAGAYQPVAGEGTSTLFKGFDFLHLGVAIDGERAVGFDQVEDFRQTLDMKRAALTTTFNYKDQATISYTVRALRQLPFNAMFDVRVTARRPLMMSVSSAIAASERLRDVQFFKANVAKDVPMLAASARSSEGVLVVGAAQRFVFDETSGAPSVAYQGQGASGGLGFMKSLAAGETFHFVLVGATSTSAQAADPVASAQRLTIYAAALGAPALIAAHERAWAELWRSDIVIEGDDTAQREVRSMLYHLYSFVREGAGYSIPPMGLSRDGYGGHIFWDAETWMLPTLLALKPALAKSMLDYRYARLGAARRNALAHGFRGAMFPWVSADSGDEDTRIAVLGGPLQIHISADVGIAAWNYFRVTQDRAWLKETGFPLICGTADFWASRVERNGPGHYDINHVVAVDEYAHNVDNDAFTNAAARENLAAATTAAKVLKVTPNPDWEVVRRNIPILRFADGATREHGGYAGEDVKQADVNLLAYPLETIKDPLAIRRDLEYYQARIDASGPAMTKSILAILYERLGMPERAYAMFKAGCHPNQLPPFDVIAETPESSNPYFATGAGGLLQTMLYGFGGLRITDAGLVQDKTTLPAPWRSLTLSGIGPRQRMFVATRGP